MTNNMASSGLWENAILTKINNTIDGTIGYAEAPGAEMCGTKMVILQDPIPTNCWDCRYNV